MSNMGINSYSLRIASSKRVKARLQQLSLWQTLAFSRRIKEIGESGCGGYS